VSGSPTRYLCCGSTRDESVSNTNEQRLDTSGTLSRGDLAVVLQVAEQAPPSACRDEEEQQRIVLLEVMLAISCRLVTGRGAPRQPFCARTSDLSDIVPAGSAGAAHQQRSVYNVPQQQHQDFRP